MKKMKLLLGLGTLLIFAMFLIGCEEEVKEEEVLIEPTTEPESTATPVVIPVTDSSEPGCQIEFSELKYVYAHEDIIIEGNIIGSNNVYLKLTCENNKTFSIKADSEGKYSLSVKYTCGSNNNASLQIGECKYDFTFPRLLVFRSGSGSSSSPPAVNPEPTGPTPTPTCEVAEFGFIPGTIALTGAGIGYLTLRKRF